MKKRYKLVLRINQIGRRFVVSAIDLPITETYKNGFKIKVPYEGHDVRMRHISFRYVSEISIFDDENEFSLIAYEPEYKLHFNQQRAFVKLMQSIKASGRDDIFSEAKKERAIRPKPL